MPGKPPRDLSDTIISFATDRQQKVAMIVGKVVSEYEARGTQVASTVVGTRIAKLVKEGRLAGLGDVSNWRFSEVRLPVKPKRGRARAKKKTAE